jgi:hypothetical protein
MFVLLLCAAGFSPLLHIHLSTHNLVCGHSSPAATLAPGSTTLIDHGSYLGIDVNNDGCRADLAILNAFTPVPGTFFGFNCRPNTN